LSKLRNASQVRLKNSEEILWGMGNNRRIAEFHTKKEEVGSTEGGDLMSPMAAFNSFSVLKIVPASVTGALQNLTIK
jgi:hypothetical protein